MDDGLKQRLIGALVLLALIVIFVPVIFDKDRIEPLDKTTQIPIAPKVEMKEIIFPDIDTSDEFEAANPVEEVFIPVEKEAVEITENVIAAAEVKATSKDKNGVPLAWVLQVASFTDDKKAIALRDKLTAGKYTAFTTSVKIASGQTTRVFVGPKLDKKRLLADKRKIEADYKLSTQLIRTKP